jgi:hypothetical protein
MCPWPIFSKKLPRTANMLVLAAEVLQADPRKWRDINSSIKKKKCFKIGILSVSPNPAYHFELSLKFGVGLSPQQGNTNLVLHLE